MEKIILFALFIEVQLVLLLIIFYHFKLHKAMAVNWVEVEQEVTETETVQASAVTLLNSLKQALDEAGTDPVKLKALSDRLNTTTEALAAAVAANTPATPPVEPPVEG